MFGCLAGWSQANEREGVRERGREGRAQRQTRVHYSKVGESVVTGPESAETGRN